MADRPPTGGDGCNKRPRHSQFASQKTGSRALRLSVTERCDLRCRYCLPAGPVPSTADGDLPSLSELAQAAAWLAGHLKIDRLKLTGGEPLLRSGLADLVRQLASIRGVREISMTSNGLALARHAAGLKGAGLTRVNISLDTLDPQRFAELTRGGDVGRVLAGVGAARAAGLNPVKLNAVLRRSSWRDDVPALLDLAARLDLEIRFIELMRTGTEIAWAEAEYVAAAEIRSWLERNGNLRPLPGAGSGPARRTLARWRGGDLRVGWITPVSHPFCGACDRLRLDAHGRLRRCLIDPASVPLVDLLRSGGPGQAEAEVARHLAAKVPPPAMDTVLPMRGIGG